MLAEIASSIGDLIPGVRVADNALSGAGSGAGTTTTVVDANNRMETSDELLNAFLRVKADSGQAGNVGQVSRVTAFATNTLTISPALAAATSTTTQYQLFRQFPPSTYMAAINEATRASYPWLHKQMRDESTNTVTSNTYYYTMPTGMFHVSAVEIQINTGVSTYPYVPVPFWVDWNSEAGRIYIPDAINFPVGAVIRIIGFGRLSEITTDAGTIEVTGNRLIPIYNYARAYLYQKMAGTSAESDIQKYETLAQSFMQAFERTVRKYRMPTPASEITLDPRQI